MNYTIEYIRVENINKAVVRNYNNKSIDEIQDIFDKQCKILKKQNKDNIKSNYLEGIVLKAILKENEKTVIEKYFI